MKQRAIITVVGSSNTDLVVPCERLPKPGETLCGGALEQHGGGKGANQAVAAARAGADVCFVGARGEDAFGKNAEASLKKEGIDTRHFHTIQKTGSGVALIFIGGKEKQNVIIVAKSANDLLSPAYVKKAERNLAQSDVVLASLEIPMKSVEAAATLAKKHGAKFVLNPAPAQKLSKNLLGAIHTIIPNEHEAFLLTGEKNPSKAIAQLHRTGCKNVIVTLGAKGALVSDGKQQELVRSPKVKPVDTVGAGDCFCAWISVGLGEGLDLFQSAKRAAKAASIAVTRTGAQNGMPWRNEV